MRILLTNDDGIDAPGIAAMHEALQGLGEIITIAPRLVQSAAGHGITYREPLMTEEVVVSDTMKGIAVEGRPADCVKVALRAIWKEMFGEGEKPDLTISGMNSGANVGINVIYSGTVAAAVESAFLGVPAIPVSLHLGKDLGKVRYSRAAQIARHFIDRIIARELDPHSVINLNIPITTSSDAPIPEARIVEMNSAAGIDAYERRVSPHGQVYYWAAGDGMEFTHTLEGSDVEALREGFVTITPLTYALTDYARLQSWKEHFQDKGA